MIDRVTQPNDNVFQSQLQSKIEIHDKHLSQERIPSQVLPTQITNSWKSTSYTNLKQPEGLVFSNLYFLCLDTYEYKYIQAEKQMLPPEPVNFPFFTPRRASDVSEGYFKMLQTRFIPNFKPFSATSIIIGLNIVVFIIIHIAYSPSSYSSFLQWPREMDPFLLDVEKIQSNKTYLYQTITALFMHESYLHLVGNTIFAFFVMYEMEFSWRLSIFLGLFAGLCGNFLTLLTLEGRFLGFSGVLTSYVGMIVALFLCHCSYFQANFRQMFCWLMVMLVFLSIMAIGFGQSLLVHLFGYAFGMLFAVGFYPKRPQTDLTPGCQKVWKVIAIGVAALIIVLACVL